MRIVRGTIDHVDLWARLRTALWPDGSVERHREDVVQTSLKGADKTVAFLSESDEGEIVGFAEGSLRSDYVNGCESSPVVFLEGIYVLSSHRQMGIARLLCDAIGIWGRSRGCSEFASDAPLDNEVSRKFHAALGFAETQRVVFFRKDIEA
ncbi:aminoglycoside 6'-N-acetyltransferase [Agrobacterium larrymoorei]|uniref:Aminoglycoside N(6')-acetyltransferase type 1 n=1 Tax=Agrobacterium larrymoorei TaxID=160699 RepID=A0ABU0UJP3_9HYPH|nr:aminoglycoside 6'-N-acetyltransferase [Agrobacterium larrymoorei]MDQ1185158.1 aminoglycoside 6'-N-acetyltransferase I [Agrobacterium larrymoorei]